MQENESIDIILSSSAASSSNTPAKRRLTVGQRSHTNEVENEGDLEEQEESGQGRESTYEGEYLPEWVEAQDPKNMSLDLEGELEREYQQNEKWGEGEGGDRGGEGDEQDNENRDLLGEAIDGPILDEGPINQLLAYLSGKDYNYLPNEGEYEGHETTKHFDRLNEEIKEMHTELVDLVTECLYLHDPTEIARVVLECDNHGCNMLIVFVLRLLFHRGADPDLVVGVEQATMPIVAAEWGEIEFFMELLERGLRIDHRGPNGMTVMHYLVSNLRNVDPRKFPAVVSATQAVIALGPNLTLRSHTQDTVLQLLERNIELGGLAFAHDAPPSEVWQLSALLQQAVSDFEAHPCLKCGRPGANNRCSRCQVARYCGAPCQRIHWRFHKRVCVEKTESKSSA